MTIVNTIQNTIKDTLIGILGDIGIAPFTPNTPAGLLQWFLDGTAYATSQYNNKWILQNLAATGEDYAPIVNTRCLTGDGSAMYVNLREASKLPATEDWTVSMYVRVQSLGAQRNFFAQYISTAGNGRLLIRQKADDTWSLFLGDDGVISTVDLSGGTVTTGWHLVVAERSGSTFTLTVDGVEIDTVTDAGTRNILQTIPALFMRGDSSTAWDGTPTDFFNGSIAELSIARGTSPTLYFPLQDGLGTDNANRWVYGYNGNYSYAGLIIDGTPSTFWGQTCPALVKDKSITDGGLINLHGAFQAFPAANGFQQFTSGYFSNPFSVMDMNPNSEAALTANGTETTYEVGDARQSVATTDTKFRSNGGRGDRKFASYSSALTGTDLSSMETYVADASAIPVNYTVIEDGLAPTNKFIGRPAVGVMADGNLIMCFVESSAHAASDGVLYLRFSDDYGATWTARDTTLAGGSLTGWTGYPTGAAPGDSEGPGEPWVIVMPNGDICVYSWKIRYGVSGEGTWFTRSTDNGVTWSAWSQITFNVPSVNDDFIYATDDDYYNEDDGFVYICGRIQQNAGASGTARCGVWKTDDNGATLEFVNYIGTYTDDIIEMGMEYLGNGRAVGMMRTTNAARTYRVTTDTDWTTLSALEDVTQDILFSRPRFLSFDHLMGEANWWHDARLVGCGLTGHRPGRTPGMYYSYDRGENWKQYIVDSAAEDSGYGDVFYDADNDQIVLLTYWAPTSAGSQIRQYRVDRTTIFPDTAPAQVTGLTATLGDTQVSLIWDNTYATPSPTDYVVQYSTDDATWTTFADGTSSATTATVTGLTNGTLYYFRVAAVNSLGTGTFSASATATPSAAFFPTSIANCLLWLDASDTGTISVSGSDVTQWDDKSGNAHHLAQTVGAERPVSGTRTMNSLNVVDFGTSEFLTRSDALGLTGNPDCTMVFVLNIDANVTGADTFMLLGKDVPVTTDREIIQATGGGAYAWRFNNGNETYSVPATGVDNILMFERASGTDIAASKLFRGGVEDSPTSSSSGTLFPNILDEITLLGKYDLTPTGSGLDGVMAEVIVYNKVLTTAEKNQLGNYLSDKWGAGWTDL
jgi:hypothetical protein